jgi:WD40 repeat protein
MRLRQSARGTVLAALLAALALPCGGGSAGGDDPKGSGRKPQVQWTAEPRATALAFSADGKLLAVALPDKSVRLHDAETGKEVKALKGLQLSAGALAFSRDGKLLASAGTSYTGKPGLEPSSFELKVWSLADGKVVHEVFDKELRKDGDSQLPFAFVAFSADGALVAYPARQRGVVVWDLPRRAQKSSWKIGLTPSVAAFAPDGKTVAIGTYNGSAHGTVEIYESATGKQPDRSLRMARYSGVRRLLFSPDGNRLLIAFRSYLYELRLANKGEDPVRALWSWETNRAKEDRWVVAADFSADGQRTALFTTTMKKLRAPGEPWENPRLLLLDNASGKIIRTLDAEAAPVALSPDGRLLAAGSGTGGLKVWRIE